MAQRKKRDAQAQRHWRRIDLHLHTPASVDYQEPSVTFLDILKKAEARGLDMIAFTDHNSVAGYARFLDEIEQLVQLEKLKRILPDEKRRLEEYQRLRQKIQHRWNHGRARDRVLNSRRLSAFMSWEFFPRRHPRV